MGDITKGYTWLNGVNVTPTRLNSMVDDATINDAVVTAAKLAGTLDLSGKTLTLPAISVTAAMLAATLDLSGKTVTLPANVVSGLTAITSLEDADTVLVWDDTDSGLKKITRANLANALGTSGTVIQSVRAESSTWAALTTTGNPELIIPNDDTIPAAGEGYEVLTVAITPRLTTSKLRVRAVTGSMASNAARSYIAMLKRDSGAAFAVNYQSAGGNENQHVTVVGEVDSSALTATTFRLDIGTLTAGFVYVQGTATERRFGGVQQHTLIVEEVLP